MSPLLPSDQFAPGRPGWRGCRSGPGSAPGTPINSGIVDSSTRADSASGSVCGAAASATCAGSAPGPCTPGAGVYRHSGLRPAGGCLACSRQRQWSTSEHGDYSSGGAACILQTHLSLPGPGRSSPSRRKSSWRAPRFPRSSRKNRQRLNRSGRRLPRNPRPRPPCRSAFPNLPTWKNASLRDCGHLIWTGLIGSRPMGIEPSCTSRRRMRTTLRTARWWRAAG